MTAGGVSAACLARDEAEALVEPWRHLAETAIEPNVFFGPDMTLAAIRHLPGGSRVAVVAAWRDDDGRPRLVGILPVERRSARFANLGSVRRGATFGFTLTTPLLAADRPDETLAAMLDCLARHGVVALVLPFLTAQDAVADALRRVTTERGHASATLGGHRRALLRSELDGAAYLRATFKSARRTKLDRQRRNLAAAGAIRFEVADDPAAVAAALPDFLALEAAGWKGRTRTALARAPGTAAFTSEASEGLARRGCFRILTLRQERRAVASWLVALSQRRGFALKIAYDETLGRFSPGVLLARDATAHILDDPAIDDADSLAIAGHPMIDGIWTARLAIESVVVATLAGPPSRSFRVAVAIERGREAIVARLKRWKDRRSDRRAPAP